MEGNLTQALSTTKIVPQPTLMIPSCSSISYKRTLIKQISLQMRDQGWNHAPSSFKMGENLWHISHEMSTYLIRICKTTVTLNQYILGLGAMKDGMVPGNLHGKHVNWLDTWKRLEAPGSLNKGIRHKALHLNILAQSSPHAVGFTNQAFRLSVHHPSLSAQILLQVAEIGMVGGKTVEETCSCPHLWANVENIKFRWRDKHNVLFVEYCNDPLQHSLNINHGRSMSCRCCVRCNLDDLRRSLKDLHEEVVGLHSDMVDLSREHQTLLNNIWNVVQGVNNELDQQEHKIANVEVELNAHLLVVDSSFGPSSVASHPSLQQQKNPQDNKGNSENDGNQQGLFLCSIFVCSTNLCLSKGSFFESTLQLGIGHIGIKLSRVPMMNSLQIL